MAVTINGSGPIAGATTVNGLTLPTDSLQPGMVLVNSTAMSSASSVSFNNVFTNSYENYVIYIFLLSNANDALWMRLRASGVDNSSSNYYSQYFEAAAAATSASRLTAQTAWRPTNVKTDGQGANSVIDLFRPYAVANTNFTARNYDPSSGSTITMWNGTHAQVAAYDGFTIYPNSGVMSGNVRIYGMRNQ